MPSHLVLEDRPASLASIYCLADKGSGLQLDFVEVAGVRIDFLQRAPFVLRLFEASSRTKTPTLGPADFPNVERLYTREGETVRWSKPDGTTVSIAFVFVQETGELHVRPQVVLGTTYASTHAVYDLFVDLIPAPINAIADCYVAWPEYGGMTSRNPSTSGTQKIGGPLMTHPGHWATLDYGTIGQPAGIPSPLEMGFTWFGHLSTRRGLYLGVNDIVGCGKWFRMERAAASVLLGVGFVPANNRLGVGVPYAAQYAMVIKPIAGEWWDASVHWSKTMHRLGHPAFEYGPIAKRSTEPQSKDFLSPIARELTVFYAGSNGTPAENGPSLEMLGDIELMKIVHRLEHADSHYMSLYSWTGRDSLGTLNNFDYFPDWLGAQGSAVTLLSTSDPDRAIRLGVTFNAMLVHPASPQYSAWGLSAFTLHNDLGARLQTALLTTSYPTGTGPAVYEVMNHSSAAARDAWLRTVSKVLADFPGTLHGLYLDTNFHGVDDHNPALPAAMRGMGSPASMQGVRALLRSIKDLLRASNPDAVTLTEGAHEFADFDLHSTTHLPHNNESVEIFNAAPMRVTALGAFQRHVAFDVTSSLVYDTERHLTGFLLAHQFQYGVPLTLAVNRGHAGGAIGQNPMFPDEISPLFTDEMALHDFKAKLWFQQRELVLKMQRGQRLRDLPNSFQRWQIANELEVTLIPEPEAPFDVVPYLDVPGTIQSVWLTREFSSLDILVHLSNWRLADSPNDHGMSGPGNVETFTITMTVADYPWLAGSHQVVEIDIATGAETPITTAVNGWTYPATMNPRQVRLFRIKNATESPALQLV